MKFLINKIFFIIFSHGASVVTELQIPTNSFMLILGRLSLVWSCVISTTSVLKFYASKSAESKICHETTDDLLLLNYLPCINEYGVLYYGQLSVFIISSLIWRTYLNFLRPHIKGNHLHENSFMRRVAHFYLDGPHPDNDPAEAEQKQRSFIEWFVSIEQPTYDVLTKEMESCRMFVNLDIPSSLQKRKNCLLMRMHESGGPNRPEDIYVDEQYFNPIRTHDFEENNLARWSFLAHRVYLIVFLMIVTGTPLYWGTLSGFDWFNQNFSLHEHRGEVSKQGRILRIYGILEQYYSCTQVAVFSIYTNVIITLYHADLNLSARLVKQELHKLLLLYHTGVRNNTDVKLMSLENIRLLQIRLLVYFDQVSQTDSFISHFSVVAMIKFIICTLFALSYFRVDDPGMKIASYCVIISIFTSVGYLHLLSWDVERRVSIQIVTLFLFF